MKRIIILVIFFTLLAACSLSNKDQVIRDFMEKAPFPESTVVLHNEELNQGIIIMYKDESGFRHAYFSRKLGYWIISWNAKLDPKDCFAWTMINDPNIPKVIFAGTLNNDEVKNVMVRQKTLNKQARIIESEQGRNWFTYFDTLENDDPNLLKIEVLSNSGQIWLKEGIYDGKHFRGKPEQ